MIRQRKEANRQALAQKKREQLAQRLAGKGQTIEDIEQPAAGIAQPNKPLNVNAAPKKTFPTSQPHHLGVSRSKQYIQSQIRALREKWSTQISVLTGLPIR